MSHHTFVESTKARQTGSQDILVLNDFKRMEWRKDVRAVFPLPLEGRGIEGEGWEGSERLSNFTGRNFNNNPSGLITHRLAFAPLTPALSPQRGEGAASVHVTPK
jgi:hypothetical protein